MQKTAELACPVGDVGASFPARERTSAASMLQRQVRPVERRRLGLDTLVEPQSADQILMIHIHDAIRHVYQ